MRPPVVYSKLVRTLLGREKVGRALLMTPVTASVCSLNSTSLKRVSFYSTLSYALGTKIWST